MLRGAVGITAFIQASLAVASANNGLGAGPAALLGLCGLAVTLGIFTRVCSTLVAVGYAAALSMPVGVMALPRLDGSAAVVGLAAAAALGLLGPGAFSIDARRFGRREIFIPGRGETHIP